MNTIKSVLVVLSLHVVPCFGIVVDTEYGAVRGKTVSVYNGIGVSDVDVFQGIPFAQDTSGQNRFKKPVRPEPWEDILEADHPGHSCPQTFSSTFEAHDFFGNDCLKSDGHTEGTSQRFRRTVNEEPLSDQTDKTSFGPETFGEDCLHLHIFSPNVTGGPYPVLFWAYGGGYQIGSTRIYQGYYKASHGIVVVTFNYRLNIFGFAATMDGTVPGNIALWDSLMALQFVIGNIANFGGDPESITVGGHSAGSITASLMMLSPVSKGMFQKVLPISSTETTLGTIRPTEDVDAELQDVAISLGCADSNRLKMVDCLRDIPWEAFYNNASWGFIIFGPVVDGPDGFLPDYPEKLREKGNIMKGPMLAGVTHDEGSAYIGLLVPEAFGDCCSKEVLSEVIDKRFVDCLVQEHDLSRHKAISAAMEVHYSPWKYPDNMWENRNAMIQILTDKMFTIDWYAQIEHHARVGPTYGYVYNYRGRNFSDAFFEWMGIPHSAILPYMWGWTLRDRNPLLPDGSRYEGLNWTEEDVAHTVYFMKLLANFITDGNPTPSPVSNPLGGSTVWPEHTADNVSVLIISNTSISVDSWRRKNLAFWTHLIPVLLETTDDQPTSVGNTAVGCYIMWWLCVLVHFIIF